jgi:hypothetical protein
MKRLPGGDPRSLGDADAVAAEVAADPAEAAELWAAVECDDPVVRFRAVDALEKASRTAPEILAGRAEAVLVLALAGAGEPAVRWHVGLLVPRLALTDAQRARAADVLQALLGDESRIAQVNALDASRPARGRPPRARAPGVRRALTGVREPARIRARPRATAHMRAARACGTLTFGRASSPSSRTAALTRAGSSDSTAIVRIGPRAVRRSVSSAMQPWIV